MPYNFGERLDKLGSRMKEINAEPITISDGTTTIPIARATPALFNTFEEMPGVSITQVTYQDWIVDACELGVFDPPAVNLIITRVNTGERFRVTSPGPDMGPYKYTTPSKKRMRIHSVLYHSGY